MFSDTLVHIQCIQCQVCMFSSSFFWTLFGKRTLFDDNSDYHRSESLSRHETLFVHIFLYISLILVWFYESMTTNRPSMVNWSKKCTISRTHTMKTSSSLWKITLEMSWDIFYNGFRIWVGFVFSFWFRLVFVGFSHSSPTLSNNNITIVKLSHYELCPHRHT